MLDYREGLDKLYKEIKSFSEKIDPMLVYKYKDDLLNYPSDPVDLKFLLFYGLKLVPSNDHENHVYLSFVLLGLDNGIDITEFSSFLPNLEFLLSNYSLLLDHPKKIINSDKFLGILLKLSPESYNIEKTKELIHKLLEDEANINNLSDIEACLESLILFKDILLSNSKQSMTADKLLELTVTASYENENHLTRYELIKEAIALRADVNREFKSHGDLVKALDITYDNEQASLLKEQGAKCGRGNDFIEYEGLSPYLQNISSISEQLSKNLLADKTYINKIPYLVHHIWFTNPSNPREISESEIKNIINAKETLGENHSKWNHIVWTNDKNLIPSSVEKLENNGIEVRSIEDYKQEFKLYEMVNHFIEKKSWGIASDAMRYNILQKFGGIYSDLDFGFSRSVENDMYKYDFFAQNLVNFFIAARADHPIMNYLVDIMERNFNSTPSYITSIPEKEIFTKTVYTTLLPFAAAFLKHANENNNNIDMIFRSDEYFDPTNNNGQIHVKECLIQNEINGLASKFHVYGSNQMLIGEDGITGERGSWIENSNE